ncbi:unnamed protein product [Lampetra fluviatilis]
MPGGKWPRVLGAGTSKTQHARVARRQGSSLRDRAANPGGWILPPAFPRAFLCRPRRCKCRRHNAVCGVARCGSPRELQWWRSVHVLIVTLCVACCCCCGVTTTTTLLMLRC